MQTFYKSNKSWREVSSRLCLFNSCHYCQFPVSYWFLFETNKRKNIYAIKTPALKQNLNYNLLFSRVELLPHLTVTQPICLQSCFALQRWRRGRLCSRSWAVLWSTRFPSVRIQRCLLISWLGTAIPALTGVWVAFISKFSRCCWIQFLSTSVAVTGICSPETTEVQI